MSVTLRFVAPDDPLVAGELELRFRVLRDPLGLGPDDVRFPFEHESLHLLAVDAGEVVGCVLFHPESRDGGRLYQMAVASERQGTGLGARLLGALEARLCADGVRRVTLHARASAVGFYEKAGYRVEGAPFHEVGIEHRSMVKDL